MQDASVPLGRPLVSNQQLGDDMFVSFALLHNGFKVFTFQLAWGIVSTE